LAKHGFDFAKADVVSDAPYRQDVPIARNGEERVLSVAYALGFLAVLTVVHTDRTGMYRIISFRRASSEEREVYDDWLENGLESGNNDSQ
jgi:uncharacterized DUF497 family protein